MYFEKHEISSFAMYIFQPTTHHELQTFFVVVIAVIPILIKQHMPLNAAYRLAN